MVGFERAISLLLLVLQQSWTSVKQYTGAHHCSKDRVETAGRGGVGHHFSPSPPSSSSSSSTTTTTRARKGNTNTNNNPNWNQQNKKEKTCL